MTGGFYFAPQSSISDDRIVLPTDESRHALKVMRVSVGDELQVVDGDGGWYLTRVLEAGRDRVIANIVATDRNVGEPSYSLTIGLGILKSAGRFEHFLEKAVELGVTRIVPLETLRTQRVKLNRERARRVMIAGLKQSMRSRLPELDEVRSLDSVLEQGSTAGMNFLAHEQAASSDGLISRASEIAASPHCAVLIGPEGGFAEEEVSMAQARGWQPVSLGAFRLRAETAAIAACAAIQMIKSAAYGSDRA